MPCGCTVQVKKVTSLLDISLCGRGHSPRRNTRARWKKRVMYSSYKSIVLIIIMSCLQRQSATAHIHPTFPKCRLRLVSLQNVCSSSWYDSDRMWLRRTYSFCSPGSHTDVSLPGWRPAPNSLGWPSTMHATAACDHSGVVILGGCCCISLDCYRFSPTVLVTSRRGLLRAYTGEAGMLKWNCFESEGRYSRAGGDGSCVADLCKLFGAFVLAVDAAPYFRWGEGCLHLFERLLLGGGNWKWLVVGVHIEQQRG